MTEHKNSKTATIAAAALGAKPAPDGDLAPMMRPATTYEKSGDFLYYRNDGPGLSDAENVVCRLEDGADALLFSSGMAAASHLLLALGPGSHVAIPETMYWFLRTWMLEQGAAFGLQFSKYKNGDLGSLKAAIDSCPTRAVWVETPANADWAITDISAAAELAHAADAYVFVDSTAATPVLTQPLALGADVVMHSATKYLNGHSDVLAGALITRDVGELWQRVEKTRTGLGSTLGAMDAWLLLRGMRTLDVRVRQHCRNAMYLAEALREIPEISHVLYPGLVNHPGHQVAAQQMTGGFGGMMSIRLKGGSAAAARAVTRTCLFRNATSLGGVESLIEHRAPVEGVGSTTPDDLLRLSVGLEYADDLLDDLRYAVGD